jgi:uncharacterized protein YbgA (DUF1722 family)
MTQAKVVELEKRLNLAMKGMNALLFGKADTVSRKERQELRKRLDDYLHGKESLFVELKDIQGSDTQEGA